MIHQYHMPIPGEIYAMQYDGSLPVEMNHPVEDIWLHQESLYVAGGDTGRIYQYDTGGVNFTVTLILRTT